MGRTIHCLIVMLCLLVATPIPVSASEQIREVWRSRFGELRVEGWHTLTPGAAAVNHSGYSIWLVEGGTVSYFQGGGYLYWRAAALHAPRLLALNTADLSCWVVQALSDEVVHLATDCTQLSTTLVPGAATSDLLAASPSDGSVWLETGSVLVHLDAAGTKVWQSSWPADDFALVVNANDGSVWTTDRGTAEAVHLRADGSEIERLPGVKRVWAEDPADGSLWYEEAPGATTALVHRADSGTVLARIESVPEVLGLLVSPADGAAWICFQDHWWEDTGSSGVPAPIEVRHLSASGAQLGAYSDARIVGVRSTGGAWLNAAQDMVYVTAEEEETARYSFDGTALGVGQGVWAVTGDRLAVLGSQGVATRWYPLVALGQYPASSYWVNRVDRSVWVADLLRPLRFEHLSPTGTGFEHRDLIGDWQEVVAMAVSPLDSSWFVIAVSPSGQSSLLHLDAQVTSEAELWRHDDVGALLALDESDGSVWTAADEGSSDAPQLRLHHFAADGAVRAAVAVPWTGTALAVNPVDSSLWVSGCHSGSTSLLHFSSDGQSLAAVPLDGVAGGLLALAVIPSDGSLYGAVGHGDSGGRAGSVFRVTDSGDVLWQQPGFTNPAAIVVDPVDNSVWVADSGEPVSGISPGSAVVHLGSNGQELWRGDTFNGPIAIDVSPDNGSVWVADTLNRQVVHLAGPLPFIDLRPDSWAYAAIGACVQADIVQGYWDDSYRPDLPVTRDQMAVYISRAVAGGDAGVQVPTGVVTPTFRDVDEEQWAYRYIEYCAAASIVQGYADGGYHPADEVNRGQMAVYIARALVTPSGDAAIPDPPGQPTFPDVTPANEWAWCYPQVEYCAAQGVVQGYWDATYRPHVVITRDQMAVYIQRAFELPT